MIAVLKAVAIAFSTYSKIPMPQFEWKDEDMRYTLCFFPWVGAVIGCVLYLWGYVCGRFQIGTLCYACIGAAIPLCISGGFHVDGFMDTMDAFRSYQPRERKLEILKDSHIGAFSVIMLGLFGLVYVGAFSEVTEPSCLKIVCMGFFLSRALSGIAVVSFPKARENGSLGYFATKADEKIVKGTLWLQSALCVGLMLWVDVRAGAMVALAGFLVFAYYYFRTKKEIGGITGDTAGYFVVLCEGVMVVVAAICNVYMRG